MNSYITLAKNRGVDEDTWIQNNNKNTGEISNLVPKNRKGDKRCPQGLPGKWPAMAIGGKTEGRLCICWAMRCNLQYKQTRGINRTCCGTEFLKRGSWNCICVVVTVLTAREDAAWKYDSAWRSRCVENCAVWTWGMQRNTYVHAEDSEKNTSTRVPHSEV